MITPLMLIQFIIPHQPTHGYTFSHFEKENDARYVKTPKEYSTNIPNTFHYDSNGIIYYMFNKENNIYPEELKMKNNISSNKTDSV